MKRLRQAISKNIHSGDIIFISEGYHIFKGPYTITMISADGYLSLSGGESSFLHNGKGINKLRWQTFKKELSLWLL